MSTASTPVDQPPDAPVSTSPESTSQAGADVTELGGGGSARPPLYVHLLTWGVVLQFMSGSSRLYGMPVPPDRVVLLAGFLAFALHPDFRRAGWRLRAIHLVMAAVVAWCLGSMLWFGTLTDPVAVFSLVDSVGIVPFALFLVAPVVFATSARRHVWVRALTLLGFYLGVVSTLEGLHLYSLVVPRSIVDPSHPHFDRALGPSLQVASNGLALMACLYPAALYAARRCGIRRWIGVAAALACLAGAFFTLTRSIWVATLLGVVAVFCAERRSRRFLVLAGVLALAVLAVVLVAVPSITSSVTERAETSRSVYDRLNANEAAVRIVAARPLQGVGVQRFHEIEGDWVWQSPDYPITNMGIDVHNVVLGYAAELGLPGLTLWLLAVGLAVAAAIAGPRRRGGSLHDARVAALAYAVAWTTVAMLVPIKYALPTSVLWVGLGIIADTRRLGISHLPGISRVPDGSDASGAAGTTGTAAPAGLTEPGDGRQGKVSP